LGYILKARSNLIFHLIRLGFDVATQMLDSAFLNGRTSVVYTICYMTRRKHSHS